MHRLGLEAALEQEIAQAAAADIKKHWTHAATMAFKKCAGLFAVGQVKKMNKQYASSDEDIKCLAVIVERRCMQAFSEHVSDVSELDSNPDVCVDAFSCRGCAHALGDSPDADASQRVHHCLDEKMHDAHIGASS